MDAREQTRLVKTLDGWEVWDGADTVGAARLGKFDSPDGARSLLRGFGNATCGFDADGNGSIVSIPVDWIGDGEPLEMSQRCLSLIGE